METKINMQPPLDLWYKIFGLVSFLAELTNADLKTIGSKDVQDKFQITRAVLDDPGLKEWMYNVKSLKLQGVLKK